MAQQYAQDPPLLTLSPPPPQPTTIMEKGARPRRKRGPSAGSARDGAKAKGRGAARGAPGAAGGGGGGGKKAGAALARSPARKKAPSAPPGTLTTLRKDGLDDYHVLEQLGEGSFGKVFKGRRRHSGQTVALKFITKHNKSERDMRNLRSEIEIMRKLDHENIIRMLDAFETPNEFCVVMEYAQGELFQILEDDRALPEEEVRAIAKQ